MAFSRLRWENRGPMKAENLYHRPIIPLTVALMAGIALGAALPGFGVWVLVPAAVGGAAVGRCLLKQAPAVVSPLILFAALGYLAMQPWASPRFPDDHVSRFVDTGTWEITGVVDSRPEGFENRTRFFLRVEELRARAGNPPGPRSAAGDGAGGRPRGRPRRPRPPAQPDPADSKLRQPGRVRFQTPHGRSRGVGGGLRARRETGAGGKGGGAGAPGRRRCRPLADRRARSTGRSACRRRRCSRRS